MYTFCRTIWPCISRESQRHLSTSSLDPARSSLRKVIGQRLNIAASKRSIPFSHPFNQSPVCNYDLFSKTYNLDAVAQRSFRTSSSRTALGPSLEENDRLLSQMNIRHVNENSFLSWCRNAYLSTVVGVAMLAEGTSTLTQSAGLGALLVGTMNLAWGTGCHVTNLIRLRHVSGMSTVTLLLHLLGSSLHCVLWAFVLVCYIGFLDESRWPEEEEEEKKTEKGWEARARRDELLTGGRKK